MEPDISPASDSVVGRILPGLQPITMRKVVGRFPVIERLIAILDRRKERGRHVGRQEHIEGRNGCYGIYAGAPSETELSV
jgi:hypothetical protein